MTHRKSEPWRRWSRRALRQPRAPHRLPRRGARVGSRGPFAPPSTSRVAWVLDPGAPAEAVELRESDTLTGGDVLPGFAVPVADQFAE